MLLALQQRWPKISWVWQRTNPAFEKLPDNFGGYYARGHDSKGEFGIFVAYSQDKKDIDGLIKTYEEWTGKKKHD